MQLHSLLVMERGWKPNVDISPNCPRCGSSNTKFCYYNNYSLTQPRYFCKGCRRYWTKGGSLRNVPVGGGCRKNRRGKSLRLSTDILSNRNIPPRGVPSGIGLSRGSFPGDSSSGPSESAGGGSHIDLALVYANFLNNPQPDSKASKVPDNEPPEEVRNSAVEDQSLPAPGIRSGTDSGVQLIEARNNAGFFGWESLSDLFLDNHLKISESTFESPGSSIKDVNNGQVFDHGMVGLLHVHHGLGIQQCSSSNNTGYFELPPLPSEGIGSRETMTSTWSDPHHLLADHSLPATELLPVLGPAQAQDPNLLVGGNFKEFDFADDDPLSRK